MLWSLILLPLLLAPLPALLGRRRGGGARRGMAAVAGATTAATGVLAVLAALEAGGPWTGTLRWSPQVALRLELPPASALLAVLVPVVATAVVAFAALHEERRGLGRLVALLTAFVGAMEMLVCAADLLTLLIAWELVGGLSWALIAHEWWEKEKPRAANVAFLVTRAGDLGLFVAAGVAFAHTGSFAYEGLSRLTGAPLQLLVGGLLVAAASKSAQLPFSPWLFAAMKGPSAVSALLHSATMVAAGAFLLVRLHPVLDAVPWFAPVALAVGSATALGGGLEALSQAHGKKLLAGSTSAHYGLMFVAAGAGYPAVAALHLVAHALFKAPLFLATGVAGSRTGSYRLPSMGLGRALPRLAAAAGVCVLALAGVPPLGGAWTKEEMVTAAGHHAPWAALLAMLAGGLSAAYATRFFLQAFGPWEALRTAWRERGAAAGKGSTPEGRPRSATLGELAPVAALAALTVGLCALWVPGVGSRLAHALGGEAPHPKAWELLLSLALVLAGIAAGAVVVRRWPRLGDPRRPGEPRAGGAFLGVGDWFALPALARATLERPVLALAQGLARFDDLVLDAPPRLAARGGRLLAAGLARADQQMVDRGVDLAAALTAWLADTGGHAVEWMSDRLPEETARWTGRAGDGARRLQTGLAHHYYTIVVVGLALVLALLFVAGRP